MLPRTSAIDPPGAHSKLFQGYSYSQDLENSVWRRDPKVLLYVGLETALRGGGGGVWWHVP